tara:strand:+ start:284 stop:676 length:393 start_codon:yes stop_codon:yes gene_type:complete
MITFKINRKASIYENICELLELEMDYYLSDFLSEDEFNDDMHFTDADELQYWLDDNHCFRTETIYYSDAMKYLKENDASLNRSMDIALIHGYDLSSINSCLLADLLREEELQENFYLCKDNIDEIFKTLL